MKKPFEFGVSQRLIVGFFDKARWDFHEILRLQKF